MKSLMVAAGLLVSATSPASAATLLFQNGSEATFAAPAGGDVIDFNSALPANFSLTTVNASIVQGSVQSAYAAPAFGDDSPYLAVGSGGSATLTSTGIGYDSLSFFIGSVDTFNTVEVLSTTGELIASYTGEAFTLNPNGDQQLPVTNRRITITRDAVDALIGGVRFLSDSPALEVDNVVFTAVPEPSTWALMMLGFGMVGTATRYRRRSNKVVYG
jgi:hypothetical protein